MIIAIYSTTALEVMMVMRDLTNRGRTTIATIHQPSTDTFNLFDKYVQRLQYKPSLHEHFEDL